MSIDGYRPNDGKRDTYWPGIFMYLCRANMRRADRGKPRPNLAHFGAVLGARLLGAQDYRIRLVDAGMSVTPGRPVQFYAQAGVDDLTETDLIWRFSLRLSSPAAPFVFLRLGESRRRTLLVHRLDHRRSVAVLRAAAVGQTTISRRTISGTAARRRGR